MIHRIYSTLLVLVASVASGATINWTDWTSTPNSTTVLGTLATPTGPVSLTYTGNVNFAQVSGGTNYWNPNTAYLSATVSNAPPASDIITVSGGTANLVSFSQPVLNPLMAWVSVNGPGVTFQQPFTILSSGCGFWGCGTFQEAGNVLSTVGGAEGHGVIQFSGMISSIAFAGGNENWRGFTVGVVASDVSGVPEPATWIFGLMGLASIAGVRSWNRSRTTR